jgi:hypothetical protein
MSIHSNQLPFAGHHSLRTIFPHKSQHVQTPMRCTSLAALSINRSSLDLLSLTLALAFRIPFQLLSFPLKANHSGPWPRYLIILFMSQFTPEISLIAFLSTSVSMLFPYGGRFLSQYCLTGVPRLHKSEPFLSVDICIFHSPCDIS